MNIIKLALISIFLSSCIARKAPQEIVVYKSNEIEIKQISNHVYQHISFLDTKSFGKVSCNGMIVIDQNEAIVFDTPAENVTSEALIDWIENNLKCKVVTVIPTHFHDDCLGGLPAFHARGILSQANLLTISLAREKNLPVPQLGFNHKKELKVGNQRVILEFPGEGHTTDNIIGYFPAEDIMFGGCLIKESGAGKGNLADANVDKWAESVKSLKISYPKTRVVIPGHGKTGDFKLLDYTINLFK